MNLVFGMKLTLVFSPLSCHRFYVLKMSIIIMSAVSMIIALQTAFIMETNTEPWLGWAVWSGFVVLAMQATIGHFSDEHADDNCFEWYENG